MQVEFVVKNEEQMSRFSDSVIRDLRHNKHGIALTKRPYTPRHTRRQRNGLESIFRRAYQFHGLASVDDQNALRNYVLENCSLLKTEVLDIGGALVPRRESTRDFDRKRISLLIDEVRAILAHTGFTDSNIGDENG